MKILFVGDIMGQCGRRMLFKSLDPLYRKYEFDAVIVNGENSAHGKGISAAVANELFSMGVDAITMGNHVWNNSEIYKVIDSGKNIIRPANLSRHCPGQGSMIINISGKKVGVLNLLGRVSMQPCDCPFEAAERELKKLKQHTDTIIVDFHAEATSEKVAMGYFLDGKATAVLGTHTHIQTADEKILPGKCAYITDVGMTGAYTSVLGVDKDIILKRFLTGLPQRFEPADGIAQLNAVIIDIDEFGKALSIARINTTDF